MIGEIADSLFRVFHWRLVSDSDNEALVSRTAVFILCQPDAETAGSRCTSSSGGSSCGCEHCRPEPSAAPLSESRDGSLLPAYRLSAVDRAMASVLQQAIAAMPRNCKLVLHVAKGSSEPLNSRFLSAEYHGAADLPGLLPATRLCDFRELGAAGGTGADIGNSGSADGLLVLRRLMSPLSDDDAIALMCAFLHPAAAGAPSVPAG
jgi:hypothetical protein